MSLLQIVVLGAGGDALVIAESIIQAQLAGAPVKLAGFLDDKLVGEELYGERVLGGLDDWPRLDSAIRFVPAIQKVKDAMRRAERIEAMGMPAERWITVIHPRAAVSSDAVIGHGAFIASCATVQPESRIGAFASLRAGAMLGHHCEVEDHAYVGPNAVMCGRSALKRGAHLGPGAVLLESKVMGEFSVAGIGAAVTKNVAAHTIVFGNPAKRVGFIRRATS
jgi:sugar O-acyltransferase (sialic acid O-acetyltransferase NeuD family)